MAKRKPAAESTVTFEDSHGQSATVTEAEFKKLAEGVSGNGLPIVRPPALGEWPKHEDGSEKDEKFVEAPEVAWFVRDALDYHTDLTNRRFACFFVKEPWQSGGGECWAQIKKRGELDRKISGHEILIKVAWTIWVALDDKQKLALVDHELCHLYEDLDSGELKYRGHDMEEFAEIIQRHGLWNEGVERFMDQAKQMAFDFSRTRGEADGAGVTAHA